jgi:hypothetical protein
MPIGTCTASLPHGGAIRNLALARPDGNKRARQGHTNASTSANDAAASFAHADDRMDANPLFG